MDSGLLINIIANASAGYWRRRPAALRALQELGGHGTRIFFTHSPEELCRLFSERLLSREDAGTRIDVIAGGDGSVSHFLSCRTNFGHDAPILLLPAGTLNAVAYDLGLRRASVFQMIRALQSGSPWHSEPRVSIDVTIEGRCHSGFVFETGYVSHVIKKFYEYPNNRSNAFAFVLKSALSILRSGDVEMSICEGGTPLHAQSLFVSGIERMIFGLRPFGRTPQLPTVAQFRLSTRRQRWGCWRLIGGNVGKLIELRGLILQPLSENRRLTISTREPANLDGEMLLNGDSQAPITVDIKRGAAVEFIRRVG
jgi:diacylglycerol kinase family enzyme